MEVPSATSVMEPWAPIIGVEQLPRVGDGESEILDFKREPWANDPKGKGKAELLRDVNQFTNHLGGSLIIGAAEDDNGHLAGFVSVPDPETVVARVRRVCHDRLSPRIDVHALTLKHEGLDLVVVNVPPSDGPVAIRHEDKWECYRRYGKSKMPMTFEEVERMWSDGRRGKILLSKIPASELNEVYLDIPLIASAAPASIVDRPSAITRHDDYFELNLAAGMQFTFPYEFVQAVWRRVPNGWCAALDVAAVMGSGAWTLRHSR